MRSWRDFLKRSKKYDRVYNWTPTSESFYRTIKKFVRKEDRILEFGSSTGHISYRLAKEGYHVTLLDIRKEALEIAKNNFKKNNVKADFICADVFDFTEEYSIAWNSGLIQCFNDDDKDKLMKKLIPISNRVLLFYPDVENTYKKRGTNEQEVPGVGDAKEYNIRKIPEIILEYFDEFYHGILEMNEIGLDFDMYWIYAKRE